MFWRQNWQLGNFGDALALLYMKRLLHGSCIADGDAIYLVGSVIATDHIDRDLGADRESVPTKARVIFWGCGKRDGTPLTPRQRAGSTILGIRGPLSRHALDLPSDTPLGDSALLLPRFHHPATDPATVGKVVWVPHVHSANPTPAELEGHPDSIVMRPEIANTAEACEAFIAAVVALAYGPPSRSGPGLEAISRSSGRTSAAVSASICRFPGLTGRGCPLSTALAPIAPSRPRNPRGFCRSHPIRCAIA